MNRLQIAGDIMRPKSLTIRDAQTGEVIRHSTHISIEIGLQDTRAIMYVVDVSEDGKATERVIPIYDIEFVKE